jgi:hypothetical protein
MDDLPEAVGPVMKKGEGLDTEHGCWLLISQRQMCKLDSLAEERTFSSP